jgi:uncharacterized protein YehS (DUF1456 family)
MSRPTIGAPSSAGYTAAMISNDILRRLRYALSLNDQAMAEIFALAGAPLESGELESMLRKEDETGFAECPDRRLGHFLDGLIIYRRGKREGPEPAAPRSAARLTNNLVLKKIRIALELKEEDMLAALKAGGMETSKSELGALFRNEGHRNYKACGDQLLRYFLKGLTLRLRG